MKFKIHSHSKNSPNTLRKRNGYIYFHDRGVITLELILLYVNTIKSRERQETMKGPAQNSEKIELPVPNTSLFSTTFHEISGSLPHTREGNKCTSQKPWRDTTIREIKLFRPRWRVSYHQ